MNRAAFAALALAGGLAGCAHWSPNSPAAGAPAARPQGVSPEPGTVDRLVALFDELAKSKRAAEPRDPVVEPWQHADWREVFSHCRDKKGRVESEVIWGDGDVDDDSIRFVCNLAQRDGGKRVVEVDKYWTTPWYDNRDLERKSFYLERFLTGVALVDGAAVPGMLDAAHGAPYDSSFSLLKGYWPALVPPETIHAALTAWIERSKPKAAGRSADAR